MKFLSFARRSIKGIVTGLLVCSSPLNAAGIEPGTVLDMFVRKFVPLHRNVSAVSTQLCDSIFLSDRGLLQSPKERCYGWMKDSILGTLSKSFIRSHETSPEDHPEDASGIADLLKWKQEDISYTSWLGRIEFHPDFRWDEYPVFGELHKLLNEAKDKGTFGAWTCSKDPHAAGVDCIRQESLREEL